MIPTEWTTQRWKNNADCTSQKQRDDPKNMIDPKEEEMLKALLRVRTLDEVLRLFIRAKVTGFEDEFSMNLYSSDDSDELTSLDYFYADRIIDIIFKDD